jgi:hypothetical protein
MPALGRQPLSSRRDMRESENIKPPADNRMIEIKQKLRKQERENRESL